MKVLIIGDVMIDHYLLGECSRISPEAPVPVVNIKKEEWRLGGAANVANNLMALKVNSTLIGLYGDDDASNQFDQLIETGGLIKNKLYKSKSRPTTVKSRVLVSGHQMIRLDRESVLSLNEKEEKIILQSFFDEVTDADILLVSDYNKGVLSEKILEIIFKTSRALNKPTIVDPKSADFSRYSGVSIVKPNRKEAEQATGIQITDKASLENASKIIRDITQCEAVIITLSEEGAALFINNHLQIISTKQQKVFDVTGAGDTYLAAFTYKYLETNNIIESCEFANHAASVVVAKIGSATASLEEIYHIKSEMVTYES